MPSTSSTPKVDVVNKQPPASPDMSTDPNAPVNRAMRLRGGCFVRCSSSIPTPNTLLILRSLGMHDTLRMLRLIVLLLSRRAPIQPAMRLRGVFLFVIPRFQLFIYLLGSRLFLVAVEPMNSRTVICICSVTVVGQ